MPVQYIIDTVTIFFILWRATAHLHNYVRIDVTYNSYNISL